MPPSATFQSTSVPSPQGTASASTGLSNSVADASTRVAVIAGASVGFVILTVVVIIIILLALLLRRLQGKQRGMVAVSMGTDDLYDNALYMGGECADVILWENIISHC